MQVQRISNGNLEYLSEEIEQNIDFSIIQRGWDYYSRNHVVDLRVEQDSTVQASVEGSELYGVSIDMDFFSISTCTCPYGGYCKHMVAVFFQLCYEQGKRPELIYQEWRMRETQRDRVLTMNARRQEARVRKTDKKKQEKALELKELDTVQGWHSFLEEKYKHYGLDSVYALDSFYDSVRRGLASSCKTWNPVLQNLIQLHGLLFVLRRMEQSYLKKFAGSSSSYYQYERQFYHRFSEQCLDRIVEQSQQVNVQEAQHVFAAGFLDTSDWLRERLMSDKESPVNWLQVFRVVWWNLMHSEQWVRGERGQLETTIADHALPEKVKEVLLLALLHLDVILGEDRQAMARYDRLIHLKHPDYVFAYLHHYAHFQYKERLLEWLRWLLPEMSSADNRSLHREIRIYCQLWSAAVEAPSVEGEWGEVMRSLLPGSYAAYTEQLMGQGLYRQWVDVQLFLSVDPMELGSDLLRKVEAQDPASLLPIYHHSVERNILQKNRAGYREAVKMMKKLERCYKRLKQTQQWEVYVQSITNRYARYRALQEELRKGKLIS